MSNWERREADALAEAIGKYIKGNPNLAEVNQSLAVIRLSVNAAATTVNTTASELSRYRAEVCAICRKSKLYECDVADGWSSNCAFVFENTTQFGIL